MRKALLATSFLLCMTYVSAQEKGFTIIGDVGLPDGYVAGVVCQTDTAHSVDMGDTVIHGGRFILKGKVGKPQRGTLMTNNLRLVDQNKWPVDSVRWTYTDIFLSDDTIYVDRNLHVTGGSIQADFNDLQAMGGENNADVWAFIGNHPKSVVSVYLANNMLKRGYNLTKAEIERLSEMITDVPADTSRLREFRQRIAYALKTIKGGTLVDMELKDVHGKVCGLTDVVPKNKYVLVDFWASWCGICLAAMPEIRQIADEHKDKFTVIGVSIDTKEAAWRGAMAKHPEPWAQYMTTPKGYKTLFDKYQVGNGVPYYLMIAPNGTVLGSPSRPADIKIMLGE